MFNGLFGLLSNDIGIDLGTANTWFTSKITASSAVAFVVAVQSQQHVPRRRRRGQRMLGPPRNMSPSGLERRRLATSRSPSDARHSIQSQSRGFFKPRPRVVIAVPYASRVEKRAQESALRAGAREVTSRGDHGGARAAASQQDAGQHEHRHRRGTTGRAHLALGAVCCRRCASRATNSTNPSSST